jgi:hypothetical protein
MDKITLEKIENLQTLSCFATSATKYKSALRNVEDLSIQSFCDVTPVHWAVVSQHFEAKTCLCLKLSKVPCNYSVLEDGTTTLPRNDRKRFPRDVA